MMHSPALSPHSLHAWLTQLLRQNPSLPIPRHRTQCPPCAAWPASSPEAWPQSLLKHQKQTLLVAEKELPSGGCGRRGSRFGGFGFGDFFGRIDEEADNGSDAGGLAVGDDNGNKDAVGNAMSMFDNILSGEHPPYHAR
ncbi:hypothetical protein Fmac_007556 [Flemingia macrophylla]|uniref:Uncharacterized protein n=1 Tax=Flemingia macrophylla TaxID=520843 RepID=A0ABD1MVD9_9FABA